MPQKVFLDAKRSADFAPYEAYTLVERQVPVRLDNDQVYVELIDISTDDGRYTRMATKLFRRHSDANSDARFSHTITVYLDDNNTQYCTPAGRRYSTTLLDLEFKFEFANLPMDRYESIFRFPGNEANRRLEKLLYSNVRSKFDYPQLETLAKDLVKLQFYIPKFKLDVIKHEKIILHSPNGDEIFDFSELINQLSFYFPQLYIRKMFNGILGRQSRACQRTSFSNYDNDDDASSFDALTDGQYGDGHAGCNLDNLSDTIGL